MCASDDPYHLPAEVLIRRANHNSLLDRTARQNLALLALRLPVEAMSRVRAVVGTVAVVTADLRVAVDVRSTSQTFVA